MRKSQRENLERLRAMKLQELIDNLRNHVGGGLLYKHMDCIRDDGNRVFFLQLEYGNAATNWMSVWHELEKVVVDKDDNVISTGTERCCYAYDTESKTYRPFSEIQ